eukprot:5952275-Heterocapsa_arctica.AAC.1
MAPEDGIGVTGQKNISRLRELATYELFQSGLPELAKARVLVPEGTDFIFTMGQGRFQNRPCSALEASLRPGGYH